MAEQVRIDAKMVQKRSTTPTEVPTIAPSEDHTDGTWNATDIYDGELFLNLADGKAFVRMGDEIYEFGLKKDKFPVVGGGQSVFNLTKNILNDFEVFEDGVISTRVFNVTDFKKITCTTTIPDGTEVVIIY